MRYIVIHQGCCIDGEPPTVRGTAHALANAKIIAQEQVKLYDLDEDHIAIIDTQSGTVIPWWEIA